MSQRYIGGLIYNPPGGFSGYFDGSGDYLTIADNAAFQMGSGAFTIECWFFGASFASNQCLVTKWADGQSDANAAWGLDLTSGVIRGLVASSTTVTTWTGPAPATNAWNHAAFVRDGSNNVSLFLNGNRVATATYSSSINNGANAVNVGSANGNNRVFTGYISNARVVKGTAVYDPTQTTYTVPNGPLQAITNTSLLTCAYPTFRDGSSNNFTITVNGNTAVSTQNPFPQTQLPNPALGNQGNGVYSMSQYQALRSQNLWPAIDQYWPYVTMMLHGNGTNGAQNNTFLDSSTNNFTITRNGNTTQGTFTPYGSNWSTYINGLVAGAYLVAASSSATAFGTGNFTIEMWVNSGAQSNTRLAGNGNSGSWSSGKWVMATSTSLNPNRFIFACNNYLNNADMLVSTTPSNDGAWHHIAVVRNSNTWTLYVDGVNQSTVTSSVSLDNGTANPIGIGYSMINGDTGYSGYISNFRMTNTAVYTSNFTPSTSNLTAITGTQLLTCQNSRWIDNSPNNLAITIGSGGNFPSIQRFSPFAPTTPYAAGTIGGSGYFDGTGDFLQVADAAAMELGSGNWTIELWVNTLTNTQYSALWTRDDGGVTAGSYVMLLNTTSANGIVTFWAADINGFSAPVLSSGSVSCRDGAWHHIAVVRNSNTLTMYVDGVSTSTASYSGAFANTAQPIKIGSETGYSRDYTGYMAGVRLVVGTAVYTSNFTPPTAPLTAVTNTSLLLNFTNAGIIDNAMMNDLETVGNAQISTSVSKFGGGSMSFDGTGDYLTIPNNKILSFESGDFTVECWFYANSLSATDYAALMGFHDGSNPSTWGAYVRSNGVFIYGSGATLTGGGTVNTATWYHFAATRSGSTVRVFLNGVQQASSTVSGSYVDGGALFRVGEDNAPNPAFNGYIDDLRITKGYARYTANFTPQRSQWQDQ